MLFRQITDERLAQYAYLIGCQQTNEALVIDPERDIDRYMRIAEAEGLTITAVAETHIHADFLSGSREFAERYGVTVYLPGDGPPDWQYEWVKDPKYRTVLLHDGDTFRIGNIEIRATHTPGHTLEHMSFVVTDRGGGATQPMGVATGDFVFVGDLGRPDLLESAAGIEGMMRPSAERLYHSAVKFLDLPDYMMVWPGHGAGSACGKALGAVPETTVGYERRFSPAIAAVQAGESEFVDFILAGQPEPPPYFARMKKLNKEGPPILGAIPEPGRMSIQDLAALSTRGDSIVLDTRRDRPAFMAAHLRGSIHAPFNRTFPTIAGSYVDPEQSIYLIVSENNREAAVLDLIRIGLDRVVGWASPEQLDEWVREGGDVATTEVIDFDEVERRRQSGDPIILDVRGASEYADGHIEDAVNIAHTRLAPRRADVPRGGRLHVHCEGGGRAGSAASFLEREGFEVTMIDDHYVSRRARPHAADRSS
ncbi:MAG: MBL fold metallo-hydrolase [Gemmatimonadetes bacterium]|nr:MBL fold metallo-hydrolase [Gemmatimonadota bacterium]